MKAEFMALCEAQNWRCCYCGVRCSTDGEWYNVPTREHVLARVNGGGNEGANLVMACAICNDGRGAMRPTRYLRRVQELGRWKAWKAAKKQRLKHRWWRHEDRTARQASDNH